MKSCLFPTLLWLCAGLPLWAQVSVPKYSNEFLQLGVSARAMAMGNTGVATTADATAGYWNPAGLPYSPTRFEGSLMHASYLGGVANYDYAAFNTRVDSNASLAFTFIRYAVDNIADTRYLIVNDVIDYARIRRFSAADNAFMLSYGRKQVAGIAGLSVGGSAKIIYRNAGNFATAWGFGLDAGVQLRRGHWLLGAHLRDVTSTFNAWSYNTAEISDIFTRTGNVIPESSVELTLPRLLVGAAWQTQWHRWGGQAGLDLEITTDGKRNTLVSTKALSVDPRLGLELNYASIVYARAGVSQWQQIKAINGSSKSWTMQPAFGLGVRLSRFQLDYALTRLGTSEEALYSHIFSLKFGFDKAR